MCIALFSYFIFYISTIEMTLKKSFLKIMIGITHSNCSDNDRLASANTIQKFHLIFTGF